MSEKKAKQKSHMSLIKAVESWVGAGCIHELLMLTKAESILWL